MYVHVCAEVLILLNFIESLCCVGIWSRDQDNTKLELRFGSSVNWMQIFNGYDVKRLEAKTAIKRKSNVNCVYVHMLIFLIGLV